MDEHALGLRERKRIETRRELQASTIELAIRDGLENTTIEAISERANVSPRTFFNYFDSKEEAVLGLRDISVSQAAIDEHIKTHRGKDMLESVVSLLVDTIGSVLTDPKLYKSRMEIIRQNPELLERQINQTIHISKQLRQAVQQVGSAADKDASLNEVQAEVLLSLCMSSIRASIRQTLASDSQVALPKIKSQVMQTINEVTSKI